MTDRTIPVSEAVLRQAVEAMENHAPLHAKREIAALRAALRQDVQQPDDRTAALISRGYRRRAGCTMLAIGRCPECGHIHNDNTHAQATPPAAPARPDHTEHHLDMVAAPARQALTEDLLAACVIEAHQVCDRNPSLRWSTAFARAIERAHGITQEDSNHG